MPDVHERLREAAPAPTTTPDFEELWIRGRRHRRLAGGAAVVGALAVIAAAIVVVPGLFDDTPRPDVDIGDAPTPTVPSATAAPGWEQIAPSPLSPRQFANAFWTGEEVLVIGGNDAPPCSGLADCVDLPDDSSLTTGAAYDPSLDTWRTITEAPTPVGRVSHAVLGNVVYLFGTDGSFLAYSVTEDEWSTLPSPPHAGRLVAAGDRVVAGAWSHEPADRGGEPRDTPDLVYEPETRTWTELPDDPLRPSFDRQMVWIGDRLVLLALDLVDQPSSTEPNLYRAAGYDFETEEWTRLADSEVIGWDPAWFWVDDRIVNPSLGSSDGGETNTWERPYPHGGMYDPSTDTWTALPPGPSSSEDISVDLPTEPYGYGFIAVAGSEYAVASGGWLLHVPTGTWQALAPPDGAPAEGMATVWAGDRLFLWGGAWFDGDVPYGLLATGWTYTPRPTTAPTPTDVAGPTRTPTEPNSEAQTVTDADREIVDRFIRFAVGPTQDRAADLPFAPVVRLGYRDQLVVELPASELGYDDNWVLDPYELADPITPGSAVGVIRHHLTGGELVWMEMWDWDSQGRLEVRVNERLACEIGPPQLVAELAGLRRVSIQPHAEMLGACAEWSRVDLFVNDRGEIEAVTFDIWEP